MDTKQQAIDAALAILFASMNEPSNDLMDIICKICALIDIERRLDEMSEEEVIEEIQHIGNSDASAHNHGRIEINDLIDKLLASDHEHTNAKNFGEQLLRNMKSVVLIAHEVAEDGIQDEEQSHLKFVSDQTTTLHSQDLKKREVIIDFKRVQIMDEDFNGQRTAACLGTGFLFKDTDEQCYVVTAAHVIAPFFNDWKWEGLRFIGGYAVRRSPSGDLGTHTFDQRVSLPNSYVLSPQAESDETAPIKMALSGTEEDYLLIPIETPAPELQLHFLTPADLAEESTLNNGNEVNVPLYGLGHSLGMPMKISTCGGVSEVTEYTFACTLNFFSGNSGSPVFALKNHKLLGMVVRGSRDFQLTPDGTKAVPSAGTPLQPGSEICQRIDFLRDIATAAELAFPTAVPEWKETPALPTGEAASDSITERRNILPYLRLEKHQNALQLQVCLHTARKAVFRSDIFYADEIAVVECYLTDTAASEPQTYSSTFALAADFPTSGTIEVRVVDLLTGIYQISSINQANAIEMNDGFSTMGESEHLFLAAYYAEQPGAINEAPAVGISVGWFKIDNQFVYTEVSTQAISALNNGTLEVQESGSIYQLQLTSNANNSGGLTIELESEWYIHVPQPDKVSSVSRPTSQMMVPINGWLK